METDDEGQFWRTSVIEIETRLRVGRGIAKTEQEASAQALRQLKRRGHPERPPPLISDGFGSNREAILLVYGQVPSYKGIGRPPTKRRPVEGWQRSSSTTMNGAASSARRNAWSSGAETRSPR